MNVEFERQHAVIDDELEDMNARLQTLQRNIAAKQLAQSLRTGVERIRHREQKSRHSGMICLRQSDEVGSAERHGVFAAVPKAPVKESLPKPKVKTRGQAG